MLFLDALIILYFDRMFTPVHSSRFSHNLDSFKRSKCIWNKSKLWNECMSKYFKDIWWQPLVSQCLMIRCQLQYYCKFSRNLEKDLFPIFCTWHQIYPGFLRKSLSIIIFYIRRMMCSEVGPGIADLTVVLYLSYLRVITHRYTNLSVRRKQFGHL